MLIKKNLLNKDNIYRRNRLFFKKYLPDSSNNIRILDIGCGTGENTVNLALTYPNAEVIGVDASLGSLNLANKLKNFLNINNLKFIEHNNQTGFKNFGKFDLILCAGVLHHLDHPKETLKNISKLMIQNKTILSLQIYSSYGKDLEKHTRQVVRELFPDDNKMEERLNFIKKIGLLKIYQAPGFFYRRKKDIVFDITVRICKAIKTLFLSEYVRVTKDTTIFDAFVNPVCNFYNAEDIDELLQDTNLELLDFNFRPWYQKKSENIIDSYLKDKEKIEILKIKAKFIYPQDYVLILKSL